jgi:type-F conjugative transfer system secretin TraK
MRKLLVLLLVATPAFGLQIKEVKGNHRITGDIALNSINRITVADDRILQVFGLTEETIIETDEVTGQIFLRVKQDKAIDLNIITEKEVTFDLHLTPKKIPGETILIKFNKVVAINSKEKNSTYVEELCTLMKAMVLPQTITGYEKEEVNRDIMLWDNVKVQQITEYRGSKLLGEVYVLTNKTAQTMFLTETQFGWKQGIASVYIGKNVLLPTETTKLYLIRHIL